MSRNQHRSSQPMRGGQHRQSRRRGSDQASREWRVQEDLPPEGSYSGELPQHERATQERGKHEQDDVPTKPKRQRIVLADGAGSKTGMRPRVELAQQTSWGELLIKDLISVQRRAGLAIAAVMLGMLGGLPVVFALAPDLAGLEVVGVPLAWVVLGVAPFPLVFGAGWLYKRIAERQERAFVDMIEN